MHSGSKGGWQFNDAFAELSHRRYALDQHPDMISLVAVGLCAIAAILVWTSLGLAVGRRSFRNFPDSAAPALGYALFSAPALTIFMVVGLNQTSAGLALLISFGVSGWFLSKRRHASQTPVTEIGLVACIIAAVLAVVPMLAVLPKIGGDGAAFAIQIFDHSKAALIDEIVRSGAPPVNPFIGSASGFDGLAYYYLWHFSAGLFASAFNASGWEADIALTWATAFASLTLMMGVAVRWSGRRAGAYWVVLLSGAVSMRPLIVRTVCGPDFCNAITGYPGLQDWLVQASWVPQHLSSANSLCVALLLISGLDRAEKGLGPIILGIVVAAGFESSTYIGGMLLAAASPVVAAVLLISLPRDRRMVVLRRCWIGAVVALALIFPFLRDQYAASVARGVGLPIAYSPFEVLGPAVPERLRKIFDLPGYWLLQLPIDLPGIFLVGMLSIWQACGRNRWRTATMEVRLFAVIAGAGLIAPWLFESTIANNDFGWRTLLPAVMALTVFGASWLSKQTWRAPMPWLMMIPLSFGLFGGGIYLTENAHGTPSSGGREFLKSTEMWKAVRAHSSPTDRVANNPDYLGAVTAWPVNLSWALLANRRSCFASYELALAYGELPNEKVETSYKLFDRVFAGEGDRKDVETIAHDFGCDVVALVPSDGAWSHDPFATSGRYQVVDDRPGRWRIYRVIQTEISRRSP